MFYFSFVKIKMRSNSNSENSNVIQRKDNGWKAVITTIMNILPESVGNYNKSAICSGLVDKSTFETQVRKSDTLILTTNKNSRTPLGFFLLNLKKCERNLICGSGNNTAKSHVEVGEGLLRDKGCRIVRLESLYTAIPFHVAFGYKFDFKKIIEILNHYLSDIFGKIVLNSGQPSAADDRFLLDKVLPYIKTNRQNIVDEDREAGDDDFPYSDVDDGRVKNPVVLYIATVISNTNKQVLKKNRISSDDLHSFIHQVLSGVYPMYKRL
jgi:hypothetical protein